MEVSASIENETARMDVYKGLSACYFIPGNGLISVLKRMERQLAFLGSDAFAPMVLIRNEMQGTENLEKLKVEFARLFVGPYRLSAPPYGSIYLEGEHKIMGESTVDAHNRYLDNGLAISEFFKEAPDHIAAELEFMYYLVCNEINAIRSEKLEESYESLQKQKSFLIDHLGSWIAEFSRNIEMSTNQKFYRNLARATKIFINEDLNHLSSLYVFQTN